MPGTFSQLYIQVVFAVKGRENLINKTWRDELHKYIAGIIKGKGQKPIIVNGVTDHFINECDLQFDINLSLITAGSLVNILEGFKNSKLRYNRQKGGCSGVRFVKWTKRRLFFCIVFGL